MKVYVDPERCQGHTLCAATAPAVFFLRDEDGHAYVKDENVPPEHEEAARAAASTCPERAIRIEQ